MVSQFTDYYELLGVPRTATLEEIKQAYRKLARQHHPDLHAEKDKEIHTRRMQEANEAYSVLSSPENRAKYDQYGEHWKEGPPSPPPPPSSYSQEESQNPFSGQGAEGFSDFFKNMFRQGAAEQSFRESSPSELDIEAELELSLVEAVQGVEKSFSLMTTGLCPQCHGTGRTGKTLCPVCGGVGEIRRPRNIKTKIPPGLLDGGRIRLKDQGNESGGIRGDLFLTIRLASDSRFIVNKRDLAITVTIFPWQAALGSQVKVPTLEGPVDVRIPKGTHTGQRLRLTGKGLGKANERGDLIIRLEIDIPTTLSPKAEALYKQLESESHG